MEHTPSQWPVVLCRGYVFFVGPGGFGGGDLVVHASLIRLVGSGVSGGGGGAAREAAAAAALGGLFGLSSDIVSCVLVLVKDQYTRDPWLKPPCCKRLVKGWFCLGNMGE